MIVIGLTGGIGSGKSTVAKMLRDLGAPIFDADAVSRSSVAKDGPCLAAATAVLGQGYITPEGTLDRPKVAARIFADKPLLKRFEAVIQDYVLQQQQLFIEEQRARGAKAIVLDVPLLIECGWHSRVDRLWLVSVAVETQLTRAALRDGASREQVQARIKAQMSLEEKKKYADVIIDNSGTEAETQKQVIRAWQAAIGE